MRLSHYASPLLLAALLLISFANPLAAACGTAPAASTDGAIRFTGAQHTWGTVSSLGTAAAGDMVYDTTNDAISVCNGTSWQTLTAGGSASGSTGYVQFNNAGAFGSDSSLFWDNTNKRLGIGAAGPQDSLHIVSGMEVGTAGTVSTNQATIALVSLSGNTLPLGNASSKGWQLYARGNAYTSSDEQNDFGIAYWSGSVWRKSFVADSLTGNVGIGTTSPAQKLTVAGTIESTSGGIKFPDGTTQTTAASGGASLPSCPVGDTLVTNASGWACSSTAWRTSCKAILDAGESTGDGTYTIDPDGNGSIAAFQVYCDMTTDSGGWTLIAVGGDSTYCPELPQVSTIDLSGTCGYLSATVVSQIAGSSTLVRLRSGTNHTSYTQVTSTNSLAITALTSSGNWHNGTTWSSGWCWSLSCSSSATSWPDMYHSCGYSSCVHWISSSRLNRTSSATNTRTSTWLR